MTQRRGDRHRRAAPTPLPAHVQPGLGFEAGDAVTVTPTDYGIDPVAGTLVGLDAATRSCVARTDERAGTRARALPAPRLPDQEGAAA